MRYTVEPVTSRVPDLDVLRLLVSVARLGSIGAAARAQGITQQSASERLRTTEARVGVPLIRRGSRGSDLTPAGVVLVGWADRLLDLADEIDHAIDGLREQSGRELVVWSSLTVAETLLPGWLVRLRRRQLADGLTPTTVSLVATNSVGVLRGVRDGSAHLGFVEGAEAPPDLQAVVVGNDELVLVAAAGSPLARRRRPVAVDEIARLDMTVREAGSGTREVIEHALGRSGLELSGELVELTTATAIRSAVLAGGPPAFLSRRSVALDLASGHLVEVAVGGVDLTRRFRAVWSGPRRLPAGPARELVGIARADNGVAGRQSRST